MCVGSMHSVNYLLNLKNYLKLQDSLKLKASAPICEARHVKKIFTPVRFNIDRLCSKVEFDLNDVLTWIKSLIATLSIDIVGLDVNDEEINVGFR